jgi:hypothetical protein
MKSILHIAWVAVVGIAAVGCDTALEGQYKPYESTTPAAELWPAPDSGDSQAAAYHEAPATAPTTAPADDAGG